MREPVLTIERPLYDNHDLPPRFLKYGLDDFAEPVVRHVLERFVNDPDCWSLYLWGDTGSRKTTLGVVLMAHMRAEAKATTRLGDFVATYTAVKVINDVKNPAMRKRVDSWWKSPYLFVDDLGKHRDTPFVKEQLLHMLHYRYDRAVTEKTIITANMDLAQLGKRIDDATARRLEEGLVVKLTCPEAKP